MRRTLSTFFKIILFFCPTIIFIAYNLYVTYTPFGATKQYTVSVSANELKTSNDTQLLIGEDLQVSESGFFVHNPIYAELSRLPRIDDKTTVLPNFDHDPEQELFVSFFRTDRYDDPHRKEEMIWYPITFPGYDKLAKSAEGTVYVNKNSELKTLEHPQTTDLTELLKTYAQTRATIGSYPGVTLPIQDFAQTPPSTTRTSTTIPWQIRGDFGLYVYLPGDTLNLNFEKKDLNSYMGEDEYTLEVYRHNKLVYTRMIPDDGITDYGDAQEAQSLSFSVQDLQPDIYHLRFISNRTDGERLITSDTTIQNIEINAPYVVTDEQTVLFSQPAMAYTRKHSANIVSVDEQQEVSIYPEAYDRPHDSGVLHIIPNDDGFYTVALDNEKLLYGMFSPTKESYFEPYSLIVSNYSPDFWVIPQDLVFTPQLIKPYIKKGTLGMGIRESFTRIDTTHPPYAIHSLTLEFSSESLLK